MAWEPPTNKLEFPNIGNALVQGEHARYYGQQTDTAAAEERRKNEARAYLDPAMKGDNTAMGRLAYGDPKAAVAITTSLQRMDANKRADVKAQAEYSSNAANAILQAGPGDRAQVYRDLYADGVRRGYDMSSLPSEYTPQLDSRLRSIRQMGIDINKQLDRDVRLQIHNTPGGGGGPTQIDMPGPGSMPAAAPPAAAPGRRADAGPMPSTLVSPLNPAGTPAGSPSPQMAQSPGQDSPAVLSAPPDLKDPPREPKRNGAFFEDEPGQFGYKQRGVKDKYGNVTPMTVEGGYFVYRNPQTGEHVLYKPQKPEKAHGPEGPFAGNAMDAQAHNIILKGDPASPEYAAAYAHLTAERASQDANGQITRIKPDISGWAKPPTYSVNAPPQDTPGPVANAPPALPGGKTVTVEAGKGKPLDNAARDDLAKTSGALELTELLKSFNPSFGGYGIDAMGDAANFAKRNLPDWAGGADPNGQAQWWQRYQAVSNIERNKLFGASLTAGEQAAWKAATITPGMKPDQIKTNLERQTDIAQKAMSRLVNGMVKSGYSQEAIEAATGARVSDLPNPMGGIPQAAPPGSGTRPPLSSFQK